MMMELKALFVTNVMMQTTEGGKEKTMMMVMMMMRVKMVEKTMKKRFQWVSLLHGLLDFPCSWQHGRDIMTKITKFDWKLHDPTEVVDR